MDDTGTCSDAPCEQQESGIEQQSAADLSASTWQDSQSVSPDPGPNTASDHLPDLQIVDSSQKTGESAPADVDTKDYAGGCGSSDSSVTSPPPDNSAAEDAANAAPPLDESATANSPDSGADNANEAVPPSDDDTTNPADSGADNANEGAPPSDDGTASPADPSKGDSEAEDNNNQESRDDSNEDSDAERQGSDSEAEETEETDAEGKEESAENDDGDSGAETDAGEGDAGDTESGDSERTDRTSSSSSTNTDGVKAAPGVTTANEAAKPQSDDWVGKNMANNAMLKYAPADNFQRESLVSGVSSEASQLRKSEQSDRATTSDQAERSKTAEPPSLDKAREDLNQAVYNNIPSENDRTKFLSDMAAFEKRAAEQNLPEKEVAGTYEQLNRLLSANDGAVSKENRVLAAETFAHHMADPSNIDQGDHSTCNVTAIQEHMMNNNPAKLAEMTASLAVTGAWNATDGKRISIDKGSLQPGSEERRNNPPQDNTRSYATQLMNLAMVNDHTQRQSPPMYYSQERGGQADSGERLRFANGREVTNKDIFPGSDNRPIAAPPMTGSDVASELNRLTGENGVVLAASNYMPNKSNLQHVGSAEQLEKTLAEQQASGKFPPIVTLDSSDPHLLGDRVAQNSFHVLSLTNYDAAKHEVTLSNQWGKGSDITMSVNDLYKAMKPKW